jgi:hypothetical protein
MTSHASSGRARYALATEWVLTSALEPIFDALATPDTWPTWWRYVESATCIARGDAHGIGGIWRYTWSSRLPYRLTFDMTTTASQPPYRLEGRAAGELSGIGRWRLSRDGDAARVRYDWIVATTKGWMNRLAPLLAPVFAWNHDQVMAAGGRGLAGHLGVTLLAHRRLAYGESPCTIC